MTCVVAEPRTGVTGEACVDERPAGCPAARAACPASR
jgi:hypothetical protein